MERPAETINGMTFFPVPHFTDVEVAFGASADRYFDRRNLPDVPRRFTNIVDDLFFKGGQLPDLDERIDRDKAYRAVRAWLSSFAPPHESKVATVGYALWLWSAKEHA
ncbi:MAG: hypothetical protein KDJ39_06065 [Gammaproteobacteria bacterium]|nr:hypothetical protein [Gammaproteobacteria bacterium]